MNLKITCSLFVAFMCSLSVFAQNVIFVNHSSGVDASDHGTFANPYKTIRYAVMAAAPYDTVNIAPNIYPDTGEIRIDKPLTIINGGTSPVIIDGSLRTGLTANKYMLAVINTSNVTIDGLTFRNFVGQDYIGIWVLSNPSNTAPSRNILIQNCTVQNVGWTDDISLTPSGSSIVAIPIKIDGGSTHRISHVRLTNNHVYDCATGYAEGIVLTGNVDTFMVDHNKVHNISNIGIVVAGNYDYTGAPDEVNRARNGIVSYNEVYHCMSPVASSAGIYLDGSQNVIVSYNKCYSNAVGISVGGEQINAAFIGGHRIFDNLVYNNSVAGIFAGDTDEANPLQDTRMYSNTFFRNSTGLPISGVTTIGGASVSSVAATLGEVGLLNSDGITFQNNIFYASAGKKCLVGLSTYSVANFASNYNLYYNEDGGALVNIVSASFNGVSGLSGSPYITIEDFNAVTSLEEASRFSNPHFTSPTTFVLSLKPASNAINIGGTYNPAFSGETDYAGADRTYGSSSLDAGAYEYQGTPTAISEINMLTRYVIYPNPAYDVINVLLDERTSSLSIELIDISGKRVRECYSGKATAGKPISMSLSHIPSGTYLLQIKADGKSEMTKLIVR